MYKMMRRADVDQWFARGEIPTDISLLKGELEYLPPKFETQEMPQDVFEHTWGGGGGYGDPLDRQPERVLVDVLNDAVSLEFAEALYGVIVKNRAVDKRATEQKRVQIRTDRLWEGRRQSPERVEDWISWNTRQQAPRPSARQKRRVRELRPRYRIAGEEL